MGVRWECVTLFAGVAVGWEGMGVVGVVGEERRGWVKGWRRRWWWEEGAVLEEMGGGRWEGCEVEVQRRDGWMGGDERVGVEMERWSGGTDC